MVYRISQILSCHSSRTLHPVRLFSACPVLVTTRSHYCLRRQRSNRAALGARALAVVVAVVVVMVAVGLGMPTVLAAVVGRKVDQDLVEYSDDCLKLQLNEHVNKIFTEDITLQLTSCWAGLLLLNIVLIKHLWRLLWLRF